MKKKSHGKYLKNTAKTSIKPYHLAILVLIFVLLITGLFFLMRSNNVLVSNNDDESIPNESTQLDLSVLNKNLITTEQINVVMQNETEGTAQIKVNIPDYLQLFQAAIQADNPDRYISEALINGEIALIEKEVSARVTVENGVQVIHEEEAIKELMDAELTKVITVIMEAQ